MPKGHKRKATTQLHPGDWRLRSQAQAMPAFTSENEPIISLASSEALLGGVKGGCSLLPSSNVRTMCTSQVNVVNNPLPTVSACAINSNSYVNARSVILIPEKTTRVSQNSVFNNYAQSSIRNIGFSSFQIPINTVAQQVPNSVNHEATITSCVSNTAGVINSVINPNQNMVVNGGIGMLSSSCLINTGIQPGINPMVTTSSMGWMVNNSDQLNKLSPIQRSELEDIESCWKSGVFPWLY